MRKTKRNILLGLAILEIGLGSSIVCAENANENETELIGGERSAVRAPAAVTRNALSRKRYPGGADEDDLQVQAALPIPSRTFDPNAATASAGGGEETSEQSQPATND